MQIGTLRAQCNGDSLLCARRFDEVAFLYTHNAYNVRGHHRLPNQQLTVAQQLEMGVRGLMLDVYWQRDRAILYHGSKVLGKRPLQEDLQAIRAFLEQHPREVLSIIFESYISADQMAAELRQAGLIPHLHAQDPAQAWPTLGEMVAKGQRLVVFSEKDKGNPYPWLHHVWDYATENRYSNHSRNDFDAHYNRGDSTNRLFLLNHFLTHRKFGFGLKDSAKVANMRGNVIDHALETWSQTGHFPNFVAVDFVEVGEAGAAVQMLNKLWQPTVKMDSAYIRNSVHMPEEKAIAVTFSRPTTAPYAICLRDLVTGAVVLEQKSTEIGLRGALMAIQHSLADGSYTLELRMGTHFERQRLRIEQPPRVPDLQWRPK